MTRRWPEATKAARIAKMLAGRRLLSFEEKFWAKVDKSAGPDGCWLWTAFVRPDGYGSIGRQGSRTAIELAHRASWRLAGNELTPGMLVDHICRVKTCVNPKHLRLVTPRINAIENSIGPIAKNAAKTHCKNGHLKAPENLFKIMPKRLKTRHGKWTKPRPNYSCLVCYRLAHPGTKKRSVAEDSCRSVEL